ncbi:hypothetical protein [Nocardia wallacei]|uniref:hypothetical protein n=1 Tax=Nocardia wallacei TaxID=480035 RepID=UPI002457AA1D|nr:hypothetical protein [Nocardia wallacei]
MGFETPRAYGGRSHKIGGRSVGPTTRFTDRRRAGRPGRYQSMHVHGIRSASPMPILWVGAAVLGGVAVLLAVLTVVLALTSGPPAADTRPAVTSTVAPAPVRQAPPIAPAPCYPFQPC